MGKFVYDATRWREADVWGTASALSKSYHSKNVTSNVKNVRKSFKSDVPNDLV